MAIFPNHYPFIHIPTYTSKTTKHNILPTSTSSGNTRSSACALPLTVLSAATAVLFIFSCWLATTQSFQNIYSDAFPHFRNDIDEHDSLRVIREPVVYYGEQQVFDVRENGKHIQGIIRPEITLGEANGMSEGDGRSRLWFKAEYTVEIPICSEGYTTENGAGCITPRDPKEQKATFDTRKSVPAIETVRVSFCTGYAAGTGFENDVEEDAKGKDTDWEEKKSWDYVFPQTKDPKEIHTTGEWVFGVDKRPLESWTMVDIPGRAHDTLFRTHMVIPGVPGDKPQWQFLLTTAGVDINADAWNIYEEEVLVEVPIVGTEKDKVETVKMWRWKGRYGGCPGEKDGRGVVLEATNGEKSQASRLNDLHNADEVEEQ